MRHHLETLAYLAGIALIASACKTDYGKKEFSASPDQKEPEPAAECGDCDAPNFCLAGECVEPGAAVVEAELGDGPGEFGIQEPEEANPVAPMSLAATSGGEQVFVLDQENQRIQVIEGSEVADEIPIPSPTAQDLALLENGDLALLDPHEGALVVIDDGGDVRREVTLVGPGIPEVGRARGLFSREDGIWVQADRYFVLVLDAEGQEVEKRRLLPGHVSRDGVSLISTKILGDGSLQIDSRPVEGMPTYTQAQLRFDHGVSYLISTDTDAEGNFYIATNHIWEGDDSNESQALLTVLSPELEQLRQTDLARYETGRETFRPIAVSDAGQVFQLEVQQDRVIVRRY